MNETPLSLYFGVHEGRKADLEIVARAAIEWSTAVRLAAEMIEPSATVRLQVVDANASSFRLNAALDWIESQLEKVEKGARKRPRLSTLAVGLAIFIVVDGGPTYDYWFGENVTVELSDEDRQLLFELLQKISASTELKATTKRFFATVARDPAISSVGVSQGPEKPLAYSAPSSEFAARSGLWHMGDHVEERSSERRMDVTVLRAPLENAPKKWRFRSEETGEEFSAKMLDQNFLQSLEDGSVKEYLRIGIKLTIQVSLRERLIDGNWKPIDSSWTVLNVIIPSSDEP
ncbi:hypothetical protein [Roseinatronobacter sp.]